MATSYTKEDKVAFLLKEDAFYLLLEDGGKIILGPLPTDYTKETKP